MNAQLKLIDVRPLIRPVYRRPDLQAFPEDWEKANETELQRWFAELSTCSCDNEPMISYEEFVANQLDMEIARRQEYRDDARHDHLDEVRDDQ